MGKFSDLFKSAAQRKLEEEERRIEEKRMIMRKKARAKRKAEEAICDAEGRIETLDKDNAKSWEKARGLMKSGRRSAARLELCKYRAIGRLVEQFQKKLWVMKYYQLRLESADTDAALTDAIGEISGLMQIDPSKTLNVLDDVQGKLDEATELDRIWENVFSSETRKDSHRDSELLPDVDELMTELEKEAAREVGGKQRSDESTEENEISRGIASGRERLRNIVDAADKKRP